MRAKPANAVYRETTDSDTGHWWLYSTGTVTTYGIGYYYE